MATFTRQVPFNAYQYQPNEVHEDNLEDHILEELKLDGYRLVEAVEVDGELLIKYLIYGEVSVMNVKPGQWVIPHPNNDAMFAVQEDKVFQSKGYAEQ